MIKTARPIKAVMFDWDGTLADSVDVEWRASQAVFSYFHKDISWYQYCRYYPNWKELYLEIGINDSCWQEARTIYAENYSYGEVALFNYALPLLTYLTERKLPIGIVTSGARERVVKQIEQFCPEIDFSVVVTANEVADPKTTGVPLTYALSGLGVPLQNSLYIGDTLSDFVMAKKVGATAIILESPFVVYAERDLLIEITERSNLINVVEKYLE